MGFMVYQMALGPLSLWALYSPPFHFHSINGPYYSSLVINSS